MKLFKLFILSVFVTAVGGHSVLAQCFNFEKYGADYSQIVLMTDYSQCGDIAELIQAKNLLSDRIAHLRDWFNAPSREDWKGTFGHTTAEADRIRGQVGALKSSLILINERIKGLE